MARQVLQFDPGLTDEDLMTGSGSGAENLLPEATAMALPADQTPATKVDAATGQTVIDTAAVNPATGMAPPAYAPNALTGGQAVTGRPIESPQDLATQAEKKQIVDRLKEMGLTGGAGGDAPLSAQASSTLGWYDREKRVAKRGRGDKPDTLIDAEKWSPPQEHTTLKGIANLIGGLGSAGAQAAMQDPNRPLRLKMQDAKRIAMGQGLTQIATSLLDTRVNRFKQLQDAALKESEMSKNFGVGGGGMSASARAQALAAAGNLAFRGEEVERAQRKAAADEAQALIDADPKNIKAYNLRQSLLQAGGGFITEADVPTNLGSEQLENMRTYLQGLRDHRATQERERTRDLLQTYRESQGELRALAKKAYEDQVDLEKRRQDFWLPSNMFWASGVPPRDQTAYKEVQNEIAFRGKSNFALTRLAEIQKEMQNYAPLGGAAGALYFYLGNQFDPHMNKIANEAHHLAEQLRDDIRKHNNYGVPQVWEDELMRTRVLKPGEFLAYLQQTNSFDALKEIIDTNSQIFLRSRGVGYKDIDPEPKKVYYGLAPAMEVTTPLPLDRDGNPLLGAKYIESTGKQFLDFLYQKAVKEGTVMPDRADAPAEPAGAEGQEPEGSIQPPVNVDPKKQPPTAQWPADSRGVVVRIGGEDFSLPTTPGGKLDTDSFKRFQAVLDEVARGARRWTVELAEQWKKEAAASGDRALRAFTNLPFKDQLAIFEDARNPDGPSEAPARPLGDKPLEVNDPELRAPTKGNQPNPDDERNKPKTKVYQIIGADGKPKARPAPLTLEQQKALQDKLDADPKTKGSFVREVKQ